MWLLHPSEGTWQVLVLTMVFGTWNRAHVEWEYVCTLCVQICVLESWT